MYTTITVNTISEVNDSAFSMLCTNEHDASLVANTLQVQYKYMARFGNLYHNEMEKVANAYGRIKGNPEAILDDSRFSQPVSKEELEDLALALNEAENKLVDTDIEYVGHVEDETQEVVDILRAAEQIAFDLYDVAPSWNAIHYRDDDEDVDLWRDYGESVYGYDVVGPEDFEAANS